MPKANLTMVANIDAGIREIDFVTRFERNWDSLREILGIMRPIKKELGSQLVAYNAKVTLEDGAVGEGEEIPYSLAEIEPVQFADITLGKYAKAVSIEAVTKYGATTAVQKTDDAFLTELQDKVMTDFYAFLLTGTLTGSYDTLQMALAMAIGKVKDKFKTMHKNITKVIAFVNTLDAYEYLGVASISVQNQFGMTYLENFMGADKVILTSDIPQGKVVATPSENIDLYYIDPSDPAYAQMGLGYTVSGETNLIGFKVNGNYGTAVGETFALMGMALWAEFLDGIAVITVNGGGSESE